MNRNINININKHTYIYIIHIFVCVCVSGCAGFLSFVRFGVSCLGKVWGLSV